MLRHTYTAARLQTLDNGKPVAVFTVVIGAGILARLRTPTRTATISAEPYNER